jgi:hypothetical protein
LKSAQPADIVTGGRVGHMAMLRDLRTGRLWVLESECLIGRAPACSIRLEDGCVSLRHASLRWTGQGWEIRDLGSLNGTLINGTALTPGQNHPLQRGVCAAFGGSEAHWQLVDDGPPVVMVVDQGGRTSAAEGEMVGIPSSDDPIATIYLARDGQWQLERSDGFAMAVADGQTFEVGGHQWRFACPQVVAPTETSEQPRTLIAHATLKLGVSRDEEHVEVTVEIAGKRRELGSRAHSELLLVLARHFLADREQGLPESACGWVYVEDLERELATSAAQINIDIFRARRQFGALGLADSSEIVQRRPRTRQLRIGITQLAVTNL